MGAIHQALLSFKPAAGGGGGAAIPTWQAAAGLSASTGAVPRAWPAHQAGDVALLIVQTVGAEPATLSTPAGFVEVPNSPQFTGTGLDGCRLTLFWCRATSGAMATPTVTDAGDHALVVMVTYRGVVASGNPYDVTAGDIKTPADTTLTYPTVTTTENNCLIVLIGVRDLDATSAWHGVPVNINLTDITERFDGGNSSAGVGGGIAYYDGGKAAAGATGTSVATITSSLNGCMTVALRGA